MSTLWDAVWQDGCLDSVPAGNQPPPPLAAACVRSGQGKGNSAGPDQSPPITQVQFMTISTCYCCRNLRFLTLNSLFTSQDSVV